MEVPEADMVSVGRAEIVRAVSTLLEGVRTVHHGHMPEIEVTGGDTARGVWAMFDFVEWPPAETGERVGLNGYGQRRDGARRWTEPGRARKRWFRADDPAECSGGDGPGFPSPEDQLWGGPRTEIPDD
jgi:hypothetical protein